MLDYWQFKKINELFVLGRFEEARRMLMELQARYIALHDEVSILKEQVQDFEDIIFLSQNLVVEEGQYWLRAGGVRHGPFCKPCYEYAAKLIRLESHSNVWRCPYCGSLYDQEQIPGEVLAVNSPLARHGKVIPFSFPVQHC